MGGHPSGPAVAGGLERSTRRLGRAALERLRRTVVRTAVPSRPCSGWGLPSRTGHPVRWWSLTPPFHPHRPRLRRGAAGGLFSVALSRGSPRVAVSDHPALWSPDVPRRRGLPHRRDRPADSSVVPASLRTRRSARRCPDERPHDPRGATRRRRPANSSCSPTPGWRECTTPLRFARPVGPHIPHRGNRSGCRRVAVHAWTRAGDPPNHWGESRLPSPARRRVGLFPARTRQLTR